MRIRTFSSWQKVLLGSTALEYLRWARYCESFLLSLHFTGDKMRLTEVICSCHKSVCGRASWLQSLQSPPLRILVWKMEGNVRLHPGWVAQPGSPSPPLPLALFATLALWQLMAAQQDKMLAFPSNPYVEILALNGTEWGIGALGRKLGYKVTRGNTPRISGLFKKTQGSACFSLSSPVRKPDKGPHQNQTTLALYLGLPSLQNCEKWTFIV